jgi:hypothetical protein
MQPDRTSAAMAAMIGNRNARATRTLATPHRETAKFLHRVWLINRFFARDAKQDGLSPQAGRGKEATDQALTPAPIGQDTPVPPNPQ